MKCPARHVQQYVTQGIAAESLNVTCSQVMAMSCTGYEVCGTEEGITLGSLG